MKIFDGVKNDQRHDWSGVIRDRNFGISWQNTRIQKFATKTTVFRLILKNSQKNAPFPPCCRVPFRKAPQSPDLQRLQSHHPTTTVSPWRAARTVWRAYHRYPKCVVYMSKIDNHTCKSAGGQCSEHSRRPWKQRQFCRFCRRKQCGICSGKCSC